MKKTPSIHIYTGIFYCFFSLCLFSCQLMANNIDEETFNSISSLCSHIDGLNSANSNDEIIVFADNEVADLWNEAIKNTANLSQICKARDYYYQAKYENVNLVGANEIYGKSKALLSKVWKKLKDRILTCTDTDIVNSKVIPNFYYRALTYPHLQNNPSIDNEMQKLIEPYLLPLDHLIKKPLDKIFEKTRAIKNEKAFENAGFDTLFFQNIHSFIRVAKHKDLPGYLVKVYLDSEPNDRARQGWKYLKNRCEGALGVRQLIKNKKIVNFIVPNKWLYVLPPNESPTKKDQPVILVVTKMNIVTKDETKEAWKTKVTHKHLDELYCVLSHGLGSSGLVDNVPYTKEGVFTFLDTEQAKKTPNFDKPRHFFSNDMKMYWDKLVKSGGKIGSQKH